MAGSNFILITAPAYSCKNMNKTNMLAYFFWDPAESDTYYRSPGRHEKRNVSMEKLPC